MQFGWYLLLHKRIRICSAYKHPLGKRGGATVHPLPGLVHEPFTCRISKGGFENAQGYGL